MERGGSVADSNEHTIEYLWTVCPPVGRDRRTSDRHSVLPCRFTLQNGVYVRLCDVSAAAMVATRRGNIAYPMPLGLAACASTDPKSHYAGFGRQCTYPGPP